MGFSDRQMRALHRRVSSRYIRSRTSDGRELSYIEGWFAITEANRIFGFDGWDRETLEAKCIQAREARGSCTALYSVRVRITVHTDGRLVVRDGFGTGEGRGNRLGEAHDLALKAAETDATKRALVTFGKAFGLALYSDSRKASAEMAPSIAASGGAPKGLDASDSDDLPNGSNRTSPTRREPDRPGASLTTVEGARPGPDRIFPADRAPAPGQVPAPQVPGATEKVARDTTLPGIARAAAIARPKRRVDKSSLTLGEVQRRRDKNHLRHVASQPCILCNRILAQAHHVRFAQPKALGLKVSDEFTVPLCSDHHRELHNHGNERGWWHDMGVDPLPVAKRLWDETQDIGQRRGGADQAEGPDGDRSPKARLKG